MSTIGTHAEIPNDLSNSQITEGEHEQTANDKAQRASQIIEKFASSEIIGNGSDTVHQNVEQPSQAHLVGMDGSEFTRTQENVDSTLKYAEDFNQPTTPINVAQEIIRMQQNSEPFGNMEGDNSVPNGLHAVVLNKIETQTISEGIARNNNICSVQYLSYFYQAFVFHKYF